MKFFGTIEFVPEPPPPIQPVVGVEAGKIDWAALIALILSILAGLSKK